MAYRTDEKVAEGSVNQQHLTKARTVPGFNPTLLNTHTHSSRPHARPDFINTSLTGSSFVPNSLAPGMAITANLFAVCQVSCKSKKPSGNPYVGVSKATLKISQKLPYFSYRQPNTPAALGVSNLSSLSLTPPDLTDHVLRLLKMVPAPTHKVSLVMPSVQLLIWSARLPVQRLKSQESGKLWMVLAVKMVSRSTLTCTSPRPLHFPLHLTC